MPRVRVPVHPGEILREEFLVPLGLDADRLARHVGVGRDEVRKVADEKAPVTPRLAWLLAMAFGTTPEFWINLQSGYDLARSRPETTIEPLPRTG